jgi:hypothetical protein
MLYFIGNQDIVVEPNVKCKVYFKDKSRQNCILIQNEGSSELILGSPKSNWMQLDVNLIHTVSNIMRHFVETGSLYESVMLHNDESQVQRGFEG